MNADAFRYLYDYHFAENHKLWDLCFQDLSFTQFTQNVDYSHASLRNQIVHLMQVEEIWFCEISNIAIPDPFPPSAADDRRIIRLHWDLVEGRMRAYLAKLTDNMLLDKPIRDNDEDKDLALWQVLIHVINHATDHRSQVLRMLHDFGLKTGPQDFIFYVYDHL
jgi:uncharacterized damage-inducible protein DinB